MGAVTLHRPIGLAVARDGAFRTGMHVPIHVSGVAPFIKRSWLSAVFGHPAAPRSIHGLLGVVGTGVFGVRNGIEGKQR